MLRALAAAATDPTQRWLTDLTRNPAIWRHHLQALTLIEAITTSYMHSWA